MNVVPIVLSYIIKKKKNELSEKANMSTIGTLYLGRNVERMNTAEELAPIAFFYRRSLFACLTVLVFDHPDLQMIGV